MAAIRGPWAIDLSRAAPRPPNFPGPELMARVETIVDGGWRQSPCAPEQRQDLVCLALQEIA